MGRRTIWAFVAALALVLAACGSAAEPQAAGPTEGIQVHGEWVVAIYNADGTLDERFEFSNALLPSGADTIAQVLASSSAPGQLSVSASGLLPICESAAAPTATCFIFPDTTGTSVDTGNRFYNLTVNESGGSIVLAGSLTASYDGNIDGVSTYLGTCANTTSPADCTTQGSQFTFASVGPFNIIAGQQVQIEVTLSFS